MMFRNREEAGRLLAGRLAHLKGEEAVVLALPRGGVPVALPVARALGASLDLMLVRKLGAPGQPELGIGAVVEGTPPETVLNEDIIRALGVSREHIEREVEAALREIARRRALYLRGRSRVPLRGRSVVLVDDGIATGGTVRVALQALARLGAGRRILAVPVAPADVARALRSSCEEAVFLAAPEEFGSVGSYYEDFGQLTDAEVIALLDQAAHRGNGTPG
jgi:putative phosphoribosyl transferase